MKWKILLCLLAFAFGFSTPTPAQQDSAKVDIFAGYSYVRTHPGGYSLNGGSASVGYHITGWLSGVADFGGYHSSQSPFGTFSTFLFGPRVSFHQFRHITPFGQALFGVAHDSFSFVAAPFGFGQNVFAMTIGGGFDYHVRGRFSVRPLQVDYLRTRFNLGIFPQTPGPQTQNDLRVSTGMVLRF